MDRKEFLRTLIQAMAGLSVAPWPRLSQEATPAKTIPSRKLGKGGPAVSVLGVGGFHAGAEDEKTALRIIEAAYEEGIRFFDTAESYQSGRSESYYGKGLASVRKDVFLMTKTYDHPARSADTTRRHLEGSLKRLGTDTLDLWQLHSVRSVEDVDRAFRKGGAMEVILEAKERGVVKHVGVTGHVTPEANLRALHYHDQGYRFDAMQFPINPIDFHQKSFQRELLPEVVKRGIGVIAMKTSAAGALFREKLCTIADTIRFVLTLPTSVAVIGMESVEQVRQNAALVRRFEPWDATKLEAYLENLRPRAALELEWYKREP